MQIPFEISRLLPVPGPVWGHYPLRPADDTAPSTRRWRWRSASAGCRAVANAVPAQAQAWLALPAAEQAAALAALRRRLRRDGLQHAALVQALGVATAVAEQVLGQRARPTQCLAAAALLDNRLAEMATGEGKTLAVALAAAVAALAGVPVHVVTANDYLAARDAATLAPFFNALGLRVATLAGLDEGCSDETRRAVYQHDLVYATAKALAFDHLRDRQAMPTLREPELLASRLMRHDASSVAPAPLQRGLCMALLDEADSILLDEAEMPLILSRSVPQAARRAFLWQALALARQLVNGQHFHVHPADKRASLSDAGDERLAELCAGLGGPWRRPRYRREAVGIALAALHVFRRDEHYVLRDGAIELLDEVTGRTAPGRVWSRGLHTVVALKEGLRPAAETETLAQTTFQRFFQRYWRLCGISGTLWEARGEMRRVYGLATLRVPLHQISQRRDLPPRRFANADALWPAVADRLAALQAAGRAVLVGTDSVADSQRLAVLLQARGIPHQVLNALNDAQEAAVVAAAGRSGAVTVATRMAGRGTDIVIDAAARAAGGLHVLCCQHNASRRLDRQLAGRAGRHGDPGSTESWSMTVLSTANDQPLLPKLVPWNLTTVDEVLPWITTMFRRWPQWREEQRRAQLRQSLLQQDLDWERRLSFAGPPA